MRQDAGECLRQDFDNGDMRGVKEERMMIQFNKKMA